MPPSLLKLPGSIFMILKASLSSKSGEERAKGNHSIWRILSGRIQFLQLGMSLPSSYIQEKNVELK
jgi:hypothetical protein